MEAFSKLHFCSETHVARNVIDGILTEARIMVNKEVYNLRYNLIKWAFYCWISWKKMTEEEHLFDEIINHILKVVLCTLIIKILVK